MLPIAVDTPGASPSATASRQVWIVIAAYNEGQRLGRTLQALCRSQPRVIVVDDGSCDDTPAVALHHPVWLLRHLFNCGQGAALQTGIDFALAQGADIVVTFDADGQHAAEEIERLIAPVVAGEVDVVLGSRFLGDTIGLRWSRWLVLKLGVVFTWVFSGMRVTDTHNGLRALSRAAAQRLRITQNRMAHASEILDQIRQYELRFQEVPVTIRYGDDKSTGQSSWNAFRIVGQLVLGRMIS